MRKNLFAQTDALIREHNESNEESMTYTLGHNLFSDMTEEERKSMLGLNRIAPLDGPQQFHMLGKSSKTGSIKNFSSDSIPISVDWRDEGAVTPIQDQGQCGSCWTFMTNGALEGAYKIAGGDLFNLSEQQILDCATSSIGGYGCDGGDINTGFSYLMSNNAINETDYPYTGVQSGCSASNKNTTNVWVKNYNYVTPGNGNQIKAALATGPVGIAINASGVKFTFYRSGVF